jgi:hypothetical protein
VKGGIFVRGSRGYRTHEPQGFWEVKDLSTESVVQWKELSWSQGHLLPEEELSLVLDVLQEKPAPSPPQRVLEPDKAASEDQPVKLGWPAQVPPVVAAASKGWTWRVNGSVIATSALLLSLVAIIFNLQAGRGRQGRRQLEQVQKQLDQIESAIGSVEVRLEALEAARVAGSRQPEVAVASEEEEAHPNTTPLLARPTAPAARRGSGSLQIPPTSVLATSTPSVSLQSEPSDGSDPKPKPKEGDKSVSAPIPPDSVTSAAAPSLAPASTAPALPPAGNPLAVSPEEPKNPKAESEQGDKSAEKSIPSDGGSPPASKPEKPPFPEPR